MENPPKTYYRQIARIEDRIGVSGVLTLLADVARNHAEAANAAGGDGAEEWQSAFELLRGYAATIGTLVQETI